MQKSVEGYWRHLWAWIAPIRNFQSFKALVLATGWSVWAENLGGVFFHPIFSYFWWFNPIWELFFSWHTLIYIYIQYINIHTHTYIYIPIPIHTYKYMYAGRMLCEKDREKVLPIPISNFTGAQCTSSFLSAAQHQYATTLTKKKNTISPTGPGGIFLKNYIRETLMLLQLS